MKKKTKKKKKKTHTNDTALMRMLMWHYVVRTWHEDHFPHLTSYSYNTNIGIKHGFSYINIRQVAREVLKTEAGGRGF